jgi:hypothetical protein
LSEQSSRNIFLRIVHPDARISPPFFLSSRCKVFFSSLSLKGLIHRWFFWGLVPLLLIQTRNTDFFLFALISSPRPIWHATLDSEYLVGKVVFWLETCRLISCVTRVVELVLVTQYSDGSRLDESSNQCTNACRRSLKLFLAELSRSLDFTAVAEDDEPTGCDGCCRIRWSGDTRLW